MNREDFEKYIEEFYGISGEYPFARDLETCVFRHRHNRKWFAIIMQIPLSRVETTGQGNVWVVNLKCDVRLIGSFRQEKGIYPAYHMSKAHWLTVALDGTVAEEKLKYLLDMSYDLTKKGK